MMLYFPSLNSAICISNWQSLFSHRFPTAKYWEMIAHSTFLEVIHHIMQKERLLLCSFLSLYITSKYIYHLRRLQIHKLKINGFKTKQMSCFLSFCCSPPSPGRSTPINYLIPNGQPWKHVYAYNIIQTCIRYFGWCYKFYMHIIYTYMYNYTI